jgi:hypothetical protein
LRSQCSFFLISFHFPSQNDNQLPKKSQNDEHREQISAKSAKHIGAHMAESAEMTEMQEEIQHKAWMKLQKHPEMG